MFLKGSQIIFNKLLLNKVEHVWLYSGGAIMGLIDCFNGDNVREKSEERNTFINLHYTERISPIPEYSS